jgi:hypothetical protein
MNVNQHDDIGVAGPVRGPRRRDRPRSIRRGRILLALATISTSVSLTGCALSSDSAITVVTNAKISLTAVHRPPQPHFRERFERVARQIDADVASAPSYRRVRHRAKASGTDEVGLSLKGGGLMFMEIKAPLDARASTHHRLDVARAREIYVGQQGTHDAAGDFAVVVTRQGTGFRASCEHGRYALAGFTSGASAGSVFDVGDHSRDSHPGRPAANRLVARILDSALRDTRTTPTGARVVALDDVCQAIARDTFGHGMTG